MQEQICQTHNNQNELLALALTTAAPIRRWIRVRDPEPPAATGTLPHLPRCPDPDLVYLSPKQVARMWGASHDKVLEFIRTGELPAFNMATKTSRRPRYKITLAAVKAFEGRRSGRDSSRPPKVTQRRKSRTVSSSGGKKYF